MLHDCIRSPKSAEFMDPNTPNPSNKTTVFLGTGARLKNPPIPSPHRIHGTLIPHVWPVSDAYKVLLLTGTLPSRAPVVMKDVLM